MVLWKKESSSDDALYIDLFPSNQAASIAFNLLKLNGNIDKDEMESIAHRIKGNELFKGENWTEAMKHYNDSISCAISESEHLGFGYANRASCFLHLKMYDKCLADIELAKNANYPPNSMPKLDKRKEDCLKAMNESTEVDEKVTLEMSFSPNTKFPGLANVLDVRSNSEFGKHVVAKRDIDVSKIVMLEDAFVFGTYADKTITICKTCAKKNMNFIPCPNCTDVMFCDAKCMESNDLHKKVCGSLYNQSEQAQVVESILIAVFNFSNVEFLMKFVEDAVATRDLDSPACESDSQVKYRLFLKLFSLPQKINSVHDIYDTYKLLMDIPLIENFFHSEDAKRFLKHLIWQHLCILKTNRFGISTGYGPEYMVTIGICSSLFNHSCVPNTLQLINGNKMIAFIIRPVKKGEQLFIDYFRGNADASTGQQMLDFKCECSKCVRCWRFADSIRMKMDADYLYLGRSNVKNKDLEDHKKRPVFKEKFQNWLVKFGRLPWSPECEMMELGYIKCCKEDFFAWDY